MLTIVDRDTKVLAISCLIPSTTHRGPQNRDVSWISNIAVMHCRTAAQFHLTTKSTRVGMSR